MATSTTNGVISGAIKWTGLASGTDFASVVDKLVAIERRTITRQETWKNEWQEKIKAISDLNTRLVSLKLDAQSKDTKSELLSRKSTISNTDMMSVINTSTASLGSYDVTVGEKIQEKFVSRSYIQGSAAFGSADGQTLTIKVGDGSSVTITCDSSLSAGDPIVGGKFRVGASLAEIAEAVNSQVAAASPPVGLRAEIMPDKTVNGDVYERLVLVATDGGSANRITIDQNDVDGLTGLGQNYIDSPVYTTFLGSSAKVDIVDPTKYVGPVNKTITFVAGSTGTLGADDVEFQWADTEGHSGKFTVTAAAYASGEKFAIIQGVEIQFDNTPGNERIVKAESFTIDCQAPILQKGQDNGLAQTAKVVHSGFVDQISPIHVGGTAKFRYKYQGIEYSVNVSDRMSLGNLVNAINEAQNNPGVTASIVNDGQGTSTSYHLVLTGNHTGAESTIEVIDNDSVAAEKISNFSTANTFSVSREATNAMLKVDGFPAGEDNWIQRRSNEVSDVIDGVVLTVMSTGTSTLTVSNDHEAMRDKIMQLVQSINFCKTFILENTKWGNSNLEVGMTESGEIVTGRENPNGLMIGNYGFQIAQTNLDAFMNSALVPFSQNPALSTREKIEQRQQYYDDNGLIYVTMADIGITSDPDNQGLYKVEQNKLLSCIQQNPEAVIKLFTFTDSYVDRGPDGKERQVNIRGAAVALFEEMTKLTSTTDVTDANGNVVQKGKGLMVTLQENYEQIIENINSKIAREERRVEAVRQRYTDRFNRLEVALQQLQDKQSQLESSISSLGNNSSS